MNPSAAQNCLFPQPPSEFVRDASVHRRTQSETTSAKQTRTRQFLGVWQPSRRVDVDATTITHFGPGNSNSRELVSATGLIPVGSVVGDFVVRQPLGCGGGGQVFRAEHRATQEVVAIKVPWPQILQSDDAAKRFRREAALGKQIRHQNVVATLGCGELRGTPFLIMEFVPGTNLQAFVGEYGPLSVAHAVDVIRQAAMGLAEVHRLGVVHRDVKPSNLLLDQTHSPNHQSLGLVKLFDFGLSRFTKPVGNDDEEAGQITGTVDYMAPEQAWQPHIADPRSDLYGLGCTLHFLLTGRTVFQEDSLMQRLMAHRASPIPSLSHARPDASVCLTDIFSNLLAKRLEDRTASAGDLLAALGA